jgi:hypothetical protein
MPERDDKKDSREHVVPRRRESDMDISHSIGYMLAKMEDLDNYIRNHMQEEEKKFDAIGKSIKRIQLAIVIITISIFLLASGVPIDGILLKLLALL